MLKKCVKDYMKSTLEEGPDQFILHVGTNDLNTEKSPKFIAKSIVELATALKANSCNVGISNIIVPTNNSNLNEKGCQVKEMCKKRKLNLINHSKKIKPNHLNRGKLHLNQEGTW